MRTWHLLASILNASVSARGRYRMGKHCMDYYIGRINPSVQGPNAAEAKPPAYPPRFQTRPPSREENITTILSVHRKQQQAALREPGGLPGANQKTPAIVNSHESHRGVQAHVINNLAGSPQVLINPSEKLPGFFLER